MSVEKYDVLVIGAGSAGLGASGFANFLGLRTLLIEKQVENIGGDCLNFGCVPSKALIHVAKQVHAAKKAGRFGLQVDGEVDISKVLEYIHEKQAIIREHENVEYIRGGGIDVEIGTANFLDQKTIEVNSKKYQAKVVFLATGSEPRMLNTQGMDKMTVFTNENIFYEMKSLPKSLLVIGGGPIGCEMAQAYQRLGSQVTIINRGSRLLEKERPEISEILESVFQKEGIKIYQHSTVVSFLNGSEVNIKAEDGGEFRIDCDAVLVAVGRVVRTKGLNLEKAGINLMENGKIQVNDYLQTTNSRVYAIGDAAGRYMFSHGAEKHVRLVWRNILMPFARQKDSADHLSWVTFTDPEVATFGLSEQELHKRQISFWRQDQSLKDDDRAIVDEYNEGLLSLYFTKDQPEGNRRLLGGTLIAAHAGEIIQELHLAVETDLPIKAFINKVYAYPVGARINQQGVKGVYLKSFTTFKRKLGRWAFHLFR